MSTETDKESITPLERFGSIFGQDFRVIVPNTRENRRLVDTKVAAYADTLGDAQQQVWLKHRYALDSKMSVNQWVRYMSLPPMMFDDFLDRVRVVHHLDLRD